MDLQECANTLYDWLKKTTRFSNYKFEDCIYIDEEKKVVKMILFTNENQFSITAIPHRENHPSYLGCIMTCRKPRTGEKWTRGNDCIDGTFTKETWIEILGDIVGMELVDIKRPIKCLYSEKETKIYENKKYKNET